LKGKHLGRGLASLGLCAVAGYMVFAGESNAAPVLVAGLFVIWCFSFLYESL